MNSLGPVPDDLKTPVAMIGTLGFDHSTGKVLWFSPRFPSDATAPDAVNFSMKVKRELEVMAASKVLPARNPELWRSVQASDMGATRRLVRENI